jgi:carboxyl-terminal processing protease
MEGKRFNPYLPLLYASLVAAGFILGMFLNRFSGGIFPGTTGGSGKVNEVINYIDNNYVDTVKQATLEEKAIIGMLEQLDPHSVYIPAREFHAANDPLLGSFEGIGVQFRIESDSITVINPVSGGPSERVGIRAGDRIVKINDTLVAGIKITNNDVMRKLKGPKGTEVKVDVFRRGTAGLIDFSIIRDVIPTYSLDISYMVDASTGYIRLSNFSATTHEEFHDALQKLMLKGMKKLILDLQGNGGGYLQAAADVANEFLPKGALIVYTEGEHHQKESFYANEEGLFKEGEVVVLIDEYSASASEIVAGALQDNDRGTIIGRRSFGKGLVQEQINFKDGSALRLTVARYHTPTGRCIQKPYENGEGDYYEYYHRAVNGEESVPDSVKFSDSLKYRTPKGKIVYGGGGIYPDILVPIEKNENLLYYTAMINKGMIYRYAFEYTDRNRPELNRFTTFSAFDKGFAVTPEMMQELFAYAEKNAVKREPGDNSLSDKYIRTMLKAYIGRNVLDNPGFYPYLNQVDPAFRKALDFLGVNQ